MDSSQLTDIAFSEELRLETKAIHDISDNLIMSKQPVFMADLRAAADAMGKFYHIFKTMESGLRQNREHPLVSVMLNNLDEEQLFRTKAFEKNLKFLLGDNWEKMVRPSDDVMKYCDRIAEIGDSDPSLLIGYVYCFYLGLLSGGQILKKMAKKILGSLPDDSVAIFTFNEPLKQKETIKRSLDELKLDRGLKDKIIEEVKLMFATSNLFINEVKVTKSSFPAIFRYTAVVGALAGLSVYAVFRVSTGW